MSEVRRSIFFSVITQNYNQILTIISIIIVSRLLTPAEIGIYAIASSLILIATEFRTLGAAGYIVKTQELSKDLVQTAVGLTLLISWGLGGVIIAASSFASDFYGYPDIQDLFIILSIGFFFAPFISVSSSILVREFKFSQLFIIRGIARTSVFIVTLSLIYFDYSYFSLAIGASCGVIIEFFLSLYYRPRGYKWLPKLTKLGEIGKFGIKSSLITFFHRLDETICDLILGKLGSSHQVSIMSRSLGAYLYSTNILVAGVSSVMMPYFSSTRREKGDLYKAYTTSILLISGLTIPLFFVMGELAKPIILLLFGAQWVEAIPLMKALIFWAILRNLHVFGIPLLMSNNKESNLLIKQLIKFLISFPILIYAFNWGLNGVALGITLIALLDFLMTHWLIKSLLECSFVKLALVYTRPIIIGLSCSAVVKFIYFYLELNTTSALFSLLTVGIFIIPTWVILIFALKHPLRDEIIKLFTLISKKLSQKVNDAQPK